MGKIPIRNIICFFGVIFALIIAIQPVMAVNGTMSIGYRGSGGNYIGDTIIFDGINTYSNTTLLKITGPGLPAEGLPIYDLNGKIGSGNTIEVKPDGTWKLSWYTGTIKGIEKLQTARYYITAFDLTYPDKQHVTSVFLKKPEFYVNAMPDAATYGDYIQLTGIAERGSSMVHFEIIDALGKTAHSYDSSVSASGYFNKGFHIDMPEGVYTITMTTPSGKTTYRNYLTVMPAGSLAPNTTTLAVQPESLQPTATTLPGVSVPVTPAPSPSGAGSLSVSSTSAGATVYIDSVLMGSTPLELNTVTAGNHLVEIKAPGYLTFSLQVLVKEGQTMAISPALVRSPSPIPLSLLTVIAGLLISLAIIITRTKRRRI